MRLKEIGLSDDIEISDYLNKNAWVLSYGYSSQEDHGWYPILPYNKFEIKVSIDDLLEGDLEVKVLKPEDFFKKFPKIKEEIRENIKDLSEEQNINNVKLLFVITEHYNSQGLWWGRWHFVVIPS